MEKDAKYQLIICDEDRKITEETVCGETLLSGYPVKLGKTRSSVTIEYKKI